ncbi:MAG: hypothetical protein U0746_05190 [Gemmataceae bacterium]
MDHVTENLGSLPVYLFQTLVTMTVCGLPPTDVGASLPFARANAVCARCLASLEDMYEPYTEPKRIQTAQLAFIGDLDKLLDTLGEQKVERELRAVSIARYEGQSLACKLVAIAHDRRQRPEHYEEVEREYGSV